ncbi:MAG: hypothetical protein VW602_01570, partial [Paracoccaceae bacterium]
AWKEWVYFAPKFAILPPKLATGFNFPRRCTRGKSLKTKNRGRNTAFSDAAVNWLFQNFPQSIQLELYVWVITCHIPLKIEKAHDYR